MDRQDRLIEILIQRNIFKLPDGRDLYEGTKTELKQLLNMKSKKETVLLKAS